MGWTQPLADEPKRLVCPACDWVFYDNPRPCVGALIVRDGRVLLARRGREPYRDWWDVPGGFMEAGETPEEAVAREVAEESGLEVKSLELLAIFPDTYGAGGAPTINLHYLVEVAPGEPEPYSDVTEFRWFGPEQVPEQVAFENGRQALRAWVATLKEGGAAG
jgi:ADP-ribose pyrophosphatase YjhB (NUDIX family)